MEKPLPSGKIKGKASAGDFRKEVKKFYWDTLRSDITVVRTFKDASGQETTDASLATSYVYLISLRKMIVG